MEEGMSLETYDLRMMGNRMMSARKQKGLTQIEVAHASGLSERWYAEIERGNGSMRIETLMRICAALHVTPNDVLLDEHTSDFRKTAEMLMKLENCGPVQRETALRLLEVYLQSLE